MKVTKLKNLSNQDYQRIVKRSAGTNPEIMPKVKKIMDDVRKNGDKVLIKNFIKRFGEASYSSLAVSQEEIKAAYQQVDANFISGIKQMIKNITAVHLAQLPRKKDTVVNSEKGISVWREW